MDEKTVPGKAGRGEGLWHPAPRPQWVREINDLGRDLAASGEPLLSLNLDRLLNQARTRSGLADFGDEGFMEGLERLLWSLENEAELTLMGRIIARDDIVNALECRLHIESAFKAHPEIADEVIAAPIVIGGSGRSGTTLLHQLLALDPACRAPLGWEVRDPHPPARENDPRIPAADHAIRIWHRVTPEAEAMHPFGGLLPQECTWIMNHSFCFGTYVAFYHVPSYLQWLMGQDFLTPTYAYHRRFLQVLQWGSPRKRWVLKFPGYVDQAEYVLKFYPDAKFLHTHRDPLKVIPSMTSFMGTIVWMRSDRLMDVPAFAQAMSREFCSRLDHLKALHAQGALRKDNYRDVLYQQLVKDPLQCLTGIYEQFGMEFTPQAQRRMLDFLGTRSGGKPHPVTHRYDFAQTGLDMETERQRLSPYMQHFGIPAEV